MSKPQPRDVSYFFQYLRDKFLGRPAKGHLRFPDLMSPRTQPLPNLPPGVNAKLSNNYYYARDARREVGFAEPLVFTDEVKKLPETGKDKQAGAVVKFGVIPPLPVYNWDQ